MHSRHSYVINQPSPEKKPSFSSHPPYSLQKEIHLLVKIILKTQKHTNRKLPASSKNNNYTTNVTSASGDIVVMEEHQNIFTVFLLFLISEKVQNRSTMIHHHNNIQKDIHSTDKSLSSKDRHGGEDDQELRVLHSVQLWQIIQR